MLKNLKNKKKKRGFTLIELIIVIAIIAILAVLAIPKFSQIKKDANVKSDIANAKTIANSVTKLMAEDDIKAPTTGTKSFLINTDTSATDTDGDKVEGDIQNVPTPKSEGTYFKVIIATSGAITVTTDATTSPTNFFPQ